MLGFGKIKMPAAKLAEVLAKSILRPLESPTPQDIAFRKQAEQVGVDPKHFTFEVIAIENFAMGQAINRERLEGRMRTETMTVLTKGILLDICRHLREMTCDDLLQLGLDPGHAIELLMERHNCYIQAAWEKRSIEDVPKLFAEFCGFPKSEVLERIGWSLTQVRGDEWGELIRRKVKIIPPPLELNPSSR